MNKKAKKNPLKIHGLAIGIIVVGFVILAVLTKLVLANTFNFINETSSTTSLPLEKTKNTEDAGVTWLGKEQLLTENLKLVKDTPVYVYNEKTQKNKEILKPAVYYKLGSDNNEDIILAAIPPISIGADDYLLFRKNGQTYELLANMVSEFYFENQTKPIKAGVKYVGPALEKNVSINYDRVYPSIQAPNKLLIKKNYLEKIYDTSTYFFSDYQKNKEDKLIKFVDTAFGSLYYNIEPISLSDNTTNFTTQKFLLKLPNGQAVSYQYKPSFIADDSIPNITWKDEKNTMAFTSGGGGSCGTPGKNMVLQNINESDLQITGKTSTNENIYEFKNPENSITEAMYKNFTSQSYYTYDEKTQTNQEIKISLAEYAATHGIFIYKDPFGRYLLFRNSKYSPLAECGKPVIYLYPETPTTVSVMVDARVTKSEPAYNNGWQVLAQPNGNLTTADGQQYDSLFWEGTGHEYPEITSGTVVARADLEKTLNLQLRQLGLNDKETRDFMTFWLPKMPTTAYTRLTWLGTKEMNNLAPLTINPRPDTVIRIFLDFIGLEKPINIPTQQLSSLPRHGFTVVEWGGLLQK